MRRTFQKYLLPGLVFQGVVIGGGYGTGREIVEYFVRYGPIGGLLGMGTVTLAIWALVLALTFELARLFHAYDYRSLLIHLLGRFWISFEVFYVLLLVIVLAVVGSAAGVLIRDLTGIPYAVGVGAMFLAVAFLAFRGTELIERFFAAWSILMYGVYAAFLAVSIAHFGDEIGRNLASGEIASGWAVGGLKYGLYNMVVIPAILFCARHFETRKEALSAGAIAALIGLVPALLVFLAMLGQYPEIIEQEIPAVFILQRAGVTILLAAFVLTLFGTLIQTGTGFIHGVNERIRSALRARGKEMLDWQRPVVAVVLLMVSSALSSFGIISLVARGYSLIAWGILVLYFVPLLTVGLHKIASAPRTETREALVTGTSSVTTAIGGE